MVFIPDSKEGKMVGSLGIEEPVQCYLSLTVRREGWLAPWEKRNPSSAICPDSKEGKMVCCLGTGEPVQ